MLRNVASQKRRVYAWDVTTGLAKTGDAANITARVTKDDGTPAGSNDTNPAEVDSTNEPGYYDFDMTQAETDCAKQSWTPKSSTANISVIAVPPVVYTRPQYSSLEGIASDGSVLAGDGSEAYTSINPLQADIALWRGTQPNTLQSGRVDSYLGAGAADVISSSLLATSAVEEIRNAITGGAYALSTDANGRMRVVDGTGAGEIDTASGKVSIVAGDISSIQSGLATSAKLLAYFQLALRSDMDITNATELAEINTGGGGYSGTFFSQQTQPDYITVHDSEVGDRFDAVDSAIAGLPQDNTECTLADNAISAGKIATGALTAGKFAAGAFDAVWSVSARTLTAIDEDSTTLDLDATIRAAVGLAAANLDTQLDTLPTANEIRNAITGGAYALDTDANGRIRVVDGTGAGEINTASGAIVQVDQLGTQAKDDVNAEMVDCLNVDTYAEPGQGTPPATTTIQNRIAHLYKRMRNKKTQSATEFDLFGDDGTTVDQKATISESGGVVTFGELVSGP